MLRHRHYFRLQLIINRGFILVDLHQHERGVETFSAHVNNDQLVGLIATSAREVLDQFIFRLLEGVGDVACLAQNHFYGMVERQ